METPFHSPIRLVLKNDTWVPRPQNYLTLLDQHGIQLKKTLGQGSYAKVKLAYSVNDQKNVAVKIFEKRRLPIEYMEKFLLREIKVLSRLEHVHVISMKDVFETSTRIYMVLELAENGDLLEHVNKRKYETEEQIQAHFQQIVSGLSACHEQLVVHRDLKCENILLDANNNIKLGDFGFSREANNRSLLDTMCGSFSYSAPELIAGNTGYDGFAADCWSLGVILYCMLCGQLPYKQEDLISLSKGKSIKPLKFHNEVSEEAKSLVKGLLHPNRLKRLTCEDLKRSEWCKGYQTVPNQSQEHFTDIIAATNTVANSTQEKNVSNILSSIIRPNYGKSFYKAISRQRLNLMAINAFNVKRTVSGLTKTTGSRDTLPMTSSTMSKPSASFYTPSFQVAKTRSCSLVSEVLHCEKKINTERRATITAVKDIRDQLRINTLVKEMQLKHKTSNHSKIMKVSTSKTSVISMSKNEYSRFLEKKQQDRDKELRSVSRSTASKLVRSATYQKEQMSKCNIHKAVEAPESSSDRGNHSDVDWIRKCMMSCSRAH